MLAALARRLRAARATVLIVAAIVAGGAWMPGLARLALGGPEHVCHCSAQGGHAHCACPICVPELREDAELDPHVGPAVRGTCGDAEQATTARAIRAVAAAEVTVVLPPEAVPLPDAPAPPSLVSVPRAPPPTPPPEARRAA